MRPQLFKLGESARSLWGRTEGQDLVEYALVIAMIAFAATAGVRKLATAISGVYSTVGSTVTSSVTT
jgi:pilus assembly protein Flp/PilA